LREHSKIQRLGISFSTPKAPYRNIPLQFLTGAWSVTIPKACLICVAPRTIRGMKRFLRILVASARAQGLTAHAADTESTKLDTVAQRALPCLPCHGRKVVPD